MESEIEINFIQYRQKEEEQEFLNYDPRTSKENSEKIELISPKIHKGQENQFREAKESPHTFGNIVK